MKVNTKENNISRIQENPRYVFQTQEAQDWNPATIRFLRAAITNGSKLNMARVYSDTRYRQKAIRLFLTGAHEQGHMEAANDVATDISGEVFANGNGITRFRLLGNGIEQIAININYVGFAGKLTEEALGVTPHGHGFDMAQNDAYADYYAKVTGNSGSALQRSATIWARNTVNSRLDKIVSAGVQMAETHLEAA